MPWSAKNSGLVNCSAARHADASGTAPDRTLTAIVYLNDGWDASAHGGQLCVYNVSESEAFVAALHARHCTRSPLYIAQACNCVASKGTCDALLL